MLVDLWADNGIQMGQIIPSANMPRSKILNPPNGGTFPANQPLTFQMNVENMNLGNFVNAQKVRPIVGRLPEASHPGSLELLRRSSAS